MPKTLISSNPSFNKDRIGERNQNLAIAEHFVDTIQGEGINTGVPASFLRLKDCTLDCVWCDTASVWRFGNWYTHEELFQMWEENNVIDLFKNGQHLVLTGGSPLKQQQSLLNLIVKFIEKYGFKPYIELENECVLMPGEIVKYVDCWNNSPKLNNSGMKRLSRWHPDVLEYMSSLPNSWFKFVVESSLEWEEIEKDFLPYIKKEQIIIMPEGENQQQLNKTRAIAADLAVKYNVRMTDRLHVTIWDKKTGV